MLVVAATADQDERPDQHHREVWAHIGRIVTKAPRIRERHRTLEIAAPAQPRRCGDLVPDEQGYHPRVRTRRLGDHTVSAIGGGDLCLATSAARGVTARDVEHALHEAIVFGITLFDVAADADSEKLAGDAVRAQRVRDRVVVATRVPILAERPGAPKRDVLPERLPPPYVQARVEAALRATRLDALQLAQLALRPAWLASPAWPELVGTCARLVREGKVLAWGAAIDLDDLGDLAERGEHGNLGDLGELGNHGDDGKPGDDPALALVAEPWLAALSVVYSLCDRRAESLFAAAAKREPAIAILARQPLAGGALAGNLGPGIQLSLRDDRNELGGATLERIAVAVARLSALVKREPRAARSCDASRQAAERAVRPDHIECNDVAELALRFVIDRAGIALPRLHRREHLLPGIAAAAAPPLPSEIVTRILDDAS
jgi:aryl-alcohol dehydrogenase-like predicted oxidoreductase